MGRERERGRERGRQATISALSSRFLLLSVRNYDATIQNTPLLCTIVTHKDFPCRSARGCAAAPTVPSNSPLTWFVIHPCPLCPRPAELRRPPVGLSPFSPTSTRIYPPYTPGSAFRNQATRQGLQIFPANAAERQELKVQAVCVRRFTPFKFTLIKKFKAHSFLQFISPVAATRQPVSCNAPSRSQAIHY